MDTGHFIRDEKNDEDAEFEFQDSSARPSKALLGAHETILEHNDEGSRRSSRATTEQATDQPKTHQQEDGDKL